MANAVAAIANVEKNFIGDKRTDELEAAVAGNVGVYINALFFTPAIEDPRGYPHMHIVDDDFGAVATGDGIRRGDGAGGIRRRGEWSRRTIE